MIRCISYIQGKNVIQNLRKLRDSHSLHNILIDPLLKQLNGTLIWTPNSKGYQKFKLIFTKNEWQ